MKKIINIVLILTVMFIGIGSTFNNVDASAGSNNKSRTLTNLVVNGGFDDTTPIVVNTRNILDFSSWSDADATFINDEIVTITTYANMITTTDLLTILEADTQYTIQFDIDWLNDLGAGASGRWTLYDIETATYTIMIGSAEVDGSYSNTFTTPSNFADYDRLYIYGHGSDTATMSNIQIELGDTATDYIAYEVTVDYPDDYTITSNYMEVVSGVLEYTFINNLISVSSQYLDTDSTITSPNVDDEIYITYDMKSTTATQNRYMIGNTYPFLDNLTTSFVTYSDITTYISDTKFGFFTNANTNFDYQDMISIDNMMAFNLTDLYGSGNEPTLEEFEIILEDAPDYFDEWTYNYYEADATIGEFACERYADNLITNGDFSNGETGWTFGSSVTSHSVTNDELTTILKSNTSSSNNWIYQSIYTSLNYTNNFYTTIDYDLITFINDPASTIFRVGQNYWTINESDAISQGDSGTFSYIDSAYGNIVSYGTYFTFGLTDNNENVAIIDNVMVFDLTALFGMNNEPSQSEWEVILDANTVDGYTDGFTFEDTCYMTVEQNNPIYQYYNYLEGHSAEIDIMMTETILEMDDINPLLYIVKYDLDMVYQGVIYDGNISISSTNVDGYEEHTYEATLPAPVSTEEGYIYVAYDGVGGNILSGGYVFASVSDEFADPLTDVRTYVDAIGINNSPYLDIVDDYQFNNNYDDYLFNNANNFVIIHSRVNATDYGASSIKFYSENTDQVETIDYQNNYEHYCDITYVIAMPSSYECVFYASKGLTLPPLLNYLNINTTYTQYIWDVIEDYQTANTNLLVDGGYADNLGVYTYALWDGSDYLATGETPLYYMSLFNDMNITSHQIRNGRSLFLTIDKPYSYLDDIYTYDYLYDNNTGIYEFDINDNEEQTIIMEVFDGLTPDDATVTYHLQNVSGAYNNGASESAYDVYMQDSYVMTSAEPFPDKVDTWMDDLGMNSTLGKILVSSILLVLTTIGIFLYTKNIIAVLFVDFILLALLAVLGIIPLWIILFIIMLFFGGLFIKSRGGGGE